MLVVLLSLVGYNEVWGGDREILHKNPHVCGLSGCTHLVESAVP